MIPQADIFKTAKALRKAGQTEDALRLLQDALRRRALDPEGIDRAGRMLRKELLGGESTTSSPDVLILGQCTTSWLVAALTAAGWARNLALRVSEGAYDSVLQELNNLVQSGNRPKVAILLPWHRRLLEGAGDPQSRIRDELDFWQQAWRLVRENLHAAIIQVGYDWIVADALGHHLSSRNNGSIDVIRRMNAAILSQLPEGAYFIDLEQISGIYGRSAFYDMRRYYWTKQPFSESGTCRLAEALSAGVQALRSGSKKVLVLDLDDTLWGGVVGETGALGISLGDSPEGEAYRTFQKHLQQLSRRGVLLAVASKNNPADAREPFESNPDMVLRLADFAAFEACWEPKAATIRRIAATLNLGLDSFVFFDDNPAEREHIRQALPEVDVVEVPPDPAEYIRALQGGHWFETTGLTREDELRAEQYVVEHQRQELRASFGSIPDYLRSLEMKADMRDLRDEDMQRVVQLLAKTNQFNLTTRRHTQDDVERLCSIPGAIALTLRLRDRFGDHGLVSVFLAAPDAEGDSHTIRIDTWLMSCRVISRTVEQFQFARFLDRCRELGYKKLLGEYVPTKKNSLVSGLYDELGLTRVESAGGVIRYEAQMDAIVRPQTFVSSEPGGNDSFSRR